MEICSDDFFDSKLPIYKPTMCESHRSPAARAYPVAKGVYWERAGHTGKKEKRNDNLNLSMT